MRAEIARIFVAAAAMLVGCATEVETRSAGVSEPNLIAFVGRRISVKHVEPKGDEIPFDSEYQVHVEVLELVFGTYPQKEMQFSS